MTNDSSKKSGKRQFDLQSREDQLKLQLEADETRSATHVTSIATAAPTTPSPHQAAQRVRADHCPRLDSLPTLYLPGNLVLAKATGIRSRMRGLSHLDSMPSNYGLLFEGCRSIQTMSMRFALDLIWLNIENQIVNIDRNVPPRRLRNCRKANKVIEVNAGEADRFTANTKLQTLLQAFD